MNTKQQLVKYIFQADYKDGSKYTSTQEDVSVQDPKRSCFYDVKQDQVVRFFLFNDEHTYSVNLVDGHFEVDKVPFFMHKQHSETLANGKNVSIPLKDYRLVFYRQHTHDIDARTGDELRHDIVYHIGWQCTVKCNNPECHVYKNGQGHNYEEIMRIQ